MRRDPGVTTGRVEFDDGLLAIDSRSYTYLYDVGTDGTVTPDGRVFHSEYGAQLAAVRNGEIIHGLDVDWIPEVQVIRQN